MDNDLANGLLMIADCLVLVIGCYFGTSVLYAFFTNRMMAAFFLCLPTALCAGGVTSLTMFIAERGGPIETLYAVMIGVIVVAGPAIVVRLLIRNR